MIGRLNWASNPADIGKFRCFVYEKSPDGEGFISMGQSLEESCYGLINAYEAPKTLRLMPRQQNAGQRCRFPKYIWGRSDNWLSVDNSLIYMFVQDSTKYRVKETREGTIIEEAACLQEFVVPHNYLGPNVNSLNAARINYHNQQANRRFPTTTTTSNNYNQPSVEQQARSASSSSSGPVNDVIYLIQITKNW